MMACVCVCVCVTSALDGVSGQLEAPAALPPGKELHCPLNRRLGGPQSRSGRFGEAKNLLPLSGIEPVTEPAERLWLPTHFHWICK
jgi:hypothetical protein